MPLFARELNAIADRISMDGMVAYAHTAAPSDGDYVCARSTPPGSQWRSPKPAPPRRAATCPHDAVRVLTPGMATTASNQQDVHHHRERPSASRML